MRLIDADELIEDLKTEITNLHMNGYLGTPRPKDDLYEMINRINEQPTAYDIDKVVEEITKSRNAAYSYAFKYNDEFYHGQSDGLEKAIEIVEQGVR